MSHRAHSSSLTQAIRNVLSASRPKMRLLQAASCVWAVSATLTTQAAELPIMCVAGACGPGITFNTGGSTATAVGTTLTVNQVTESAILNWQSFNISKDGSVVFRQPSSASTALNRIYQNSPSQIFGSLSANGRVYLINQNGVVFGDGANVNVAGLLASSLDVTPEALANGLAGAALDGGKPALAQFVDGQGAALPSGAVRLEAGARITTVEGGQVLMFAPEIVNNGSITTPGGQALLAAGSPVYLATSADPNLRGLLVEVGVGGTVTNGTTANAGVTDPRQIVGQIVAERGNITLAGLAINQQGRVSATTSVRQGGSIRLQARDGGVATPNSVSNTVTLAATSGGSLRLGAGSRTEVQLDGSPETTVDANVQPLSDVQLEGARIVLERGARIVAPHGRVTLTARTDSSLDPQLFSGEPAGAARIYLETGAGIDVSGASIIKPVSSNVLTVELRGSQLADSPLQREGALRGQTVQVDIRQSGTNAGSTWVGSPIGALAGDIATIAKDVSERSLTGGTVVLQSQGDLILRQGSSIDVSGGAITFDAGYVNTSTLLGADGKAYNIGSASPERLYSGVAEAGSYVVEHPRWGITEVIPGSVGGGVYELGYLEGKDSGGVTLLSSRVVLDGNLLANTSTGRYQRRLPTAISGTALYRAFDQTPLAGLLVLGQQSPSLTGTNGNPDFALGDVRITGETALSMTGSAFDPWADVLPGSLAALQLRTDLFGEDRIGTLRMRANGIVSMDAAAQLELPVGGTLDVVAGTFTLSGRIQSPGGLVALTARPTATTNLLEGGLTLHAGGVLDVSGLWVNDSPAVNGTRIPDSPLAIDGGAIRLASQQSDMTLEAGSTVDASAGAQLTARGKLVAGKGGSIAVSTTAAVSGESVTTLLAGDLRAYAVATGGTLTITANGVCIADPGAACHDSTTAGLLRLSPGFLASGGFSRLSLSSNQRGIEVAPGTGVRLQMNNFLADSLPLMTPTGARLEAIAAIGLQDAAIRAPVDLSLRVAPSLPQNQAYNSASFAQAANLDIGAGAVIAADTGAAVHLESSTRLRVDGTVAAPAGSIQLRLNAGLNTGDSGDVYFEDQGIWLGDHARLLATGATRLLTDQIGRVSGDVLDGGTITLQSDRGHILTSAGSLLDVSGVSAEVDVRSDSLGRLERREIASAGGAINLVAAEAVAVGGSLRGHSGGVSVAGGSLSIALDPSRRADPGQNGSNIAVSLYPDAARSIELTQTAAPLVFADSTLAAEWQGRAALAADQVLHGGFDALTLRARSFVTSESGVAANHVGEVALVGNVDLGLARALTLDAALLRSDGGAATLSAPYLRFGNADPNAANQLPPGLALGAGTLRLSGGWVDVVGNSALQGLATATLHSTGDVRLIGVRSGDAILGSLSTGGSLEVLASQLYPATLTDFSLNAGSMDSGSLAIGRTGPTGDILSAGGHLTLRAPTVTQRGTLRAPFGTITLEADSITLAEGSTTSTSGSGLSVLFGQTQGGFDWVFPLGADKTLIYGSEGVPLPGQQVFLEADNVVVSRGATLDVRGGGEMLAYEFVPGTSGNRDVLSGAVSPTSFAVLPASRLASGAYDPEISKGSAVGAGQSVYLAGVGDLPAGQYIKLPARYALLEGAYLVTPVAGYQDIVAGEQYSRPGGGTIIAGYALHTGTALGDARASGFAVMAGADVQQLARYTLTSADDFLSPGSTGTARRLPRDAGTVAIVANRSLALDGALSAAAAAGGRGGALDISSSAIRVVDAIDASTGTGALQVRAADLNALGAESILLGGTRVASDAGVSIDTSSSLVTLESGATLRGPEVMLVARDRVALEAGSGITASGKAAEGQDVFLTGDGAFMRVANADAAMVTRQGIAGTTGDLDIGPGSQLTAAQGSITLEASGTGTLAGIVNANGGELSVTGNRVSIGTPAGVATGFVLDDSALNGLALRQLSLSSRSAIDLYGDVQLAATNVRLQAAAVRGVDGGNVSVAATETLALGGAATPNPVADSSASGQLHLTAADIRIEAGDLRVSGFQQTMLAAAAEIRGAGAARVAVGGDLQLRAATLTTDSGADLTISADGALGVTTPAGQQRLASGAIPDLGGHIALTAGTVDLNGRIDLNSGLLEIASIAASAGGIGIGNAAVFDLSGGRTMLGGDPFDSNGGKVQLTTRSGDVTLAAGSMIDVSASGAATAGAVAVRAAAGQLQVSGTLLGAADSDTAGGSFSADAGSLGNFAVLNRTLNAGGFTGERSFEQRGSGDLVVATDAAAAVIGTRVALSADQGRIRVDGTVRAHDAAGGRILLAARDGIEIDGTVDARGVDGTERNGRIELQSAGGAIAVAASAVVATTAPGADTGSAGDGFLRIRQSQDALLALLDADVGNDGLVLAGDWSHAGAVTVEGFRAYDAVTGSIGAAEVAADMANPYYADAATFAGQAAAIAAALGSGTNAPVGVVAGVEIRSAGDLSLDTAWALSQWRFAGQPGVLTLRAAGDLLLNASLSDGFAGVTGTNAFLLTSTAPSWSYRLASGANLGSADVLATRSLQELPLGTGNLRIAAGNPAASNGYIMIRTGTGSIDIASAANVELGNAASMIYTAGIAAPGVSFNGRFGSELGGRLYPSAGGDIRIEAGQDVVGAASTQLVTEWLWRVGGSTRATAWTVNFSRFQQNIAALGGGDVTVAAGRDIDTLSIATPTIGRQTGGLTPNLSQLEVTGGGDILATAGRDVLGGTFYSGRGTVNIQADGEITASAQTALNPVLALGDAQAILHARQNVSLDAVVTPTWLPQAIQGSAALGRSAFSTYTEDSSVRLESTAGNIDVGLTDSDGGQLRSVLSTLDFSSSGSDVSLVVMPPDLSAAALRGSIDLSGLVTLLPSSRGTLDLRAYTDVSFAGGGTAIVSDVDRAVLPSVATPIPNLAGVASALNTIDSTNVDFNADVPVRLGAARAGALAASTIVAETGDVRRVAGYFGGPVEITAGRDIRDPNVVIQNLVAGDVSTLVAGRDILYSVGRTADGAIAVNTAEIAVDGPGQLSLVAGRNVNLQNSAGVSTRGNLVNSGLADVGAGIGVLVGLNGQRPDYAAFTQKYLRSGPDYDAALSAYLQQTVGLQFSSRDVAVDRFSQLDSKLQAPLLERLLLAELRASAETAADPDPVKNGDYSRGFAALEALFPGIGSAAGAGATNRYRGDLALYFSRVYSQDGGDITLLAPGGGVNAGLATPPSAFGVGKAPDRLGIVTQRSGDIGILTDKDLQVNESRIFAVDDSDILVWSSNGDIDAGRGAKTAISAPSPVITYDRDGRASVTYTAALAGSGIQTRATSAAAEPGAVVLAAPRGVVNAGDAGIVAGNLTIAATAVLGADNIKVSGVAVGVPVDAGGLGASLAGVSAAAGSASSAASTSVDRDAASSDAAAPLSAAALSWLEVFVVGLGEENCRPDDVACLKQQEAGQAN